MDPHETIGLEADERVRLREEVPAIDANAQTVVLLTDQLAAMSNQHQEAQAAAALAQAHTQVADLDDRLKASVAAERKASAHSNQQATSLAELSARLQ